MSKHISKDFGDEPISLEQFQDGMLQKISILPGLLTLSTGNSSPQEIKVYGFEFTIHTEKQEKKETKEQTQMRVLNERKKLENTVLAFGEHAGSALKEIPLDYLQWLCEVSKENYHLLRDYLNTPETIEEINRNESDEFF